MPTDVSYEQYRDEWLRDVVRDDPEYGREGTTVCPQIGHPVA